MLVCYVSATCEIIAEVCFLTQFASIFENCIHPFALQSQQAVDPWVMRQSELQLVGRLQRTQEALHYTSKLLSVVSLLRQHLHQNEVCRMLVAFSCHRNCVPLIQTWKALPKMLGKSPPMIQGVALQEQELALAPGQICAGPHCQCFGEDSQLARHHALPDDRRSSVKIFKSKGSRKRQAVKVPLWVAWAPTENRQSQDEDGDFVYYCPRYQIGKPRVRGEENMFRQWGGHGLSRCKVPLQVYRQHEDIWRSLQTGLHFCKVLQTKIAECLGSRGVSAHMTSLLDACCIAWDWEKLLFSRPEQRHANAILQVWELLRPRVEKGFWPSAMLDMLLTCFFFAEFQDAIRFQLSRCYVGSVLVRREQWPMVTQSWALSKREIGIQYMTLLQRLRSVVAVVSQQRRNVDNIPSQVLRDAKAWTEPRKYRVRPLWAFAVFIHLVGQILGEVASHTDRCKISSMISVYLGSWEAKRLPKAAFETFMLGARDLGAVGRLLQRQRSKSKPWLAEPGQVASTKGKLVWVESVDRKINCGLVSAALDTHDFFAVGNRSRDATCCWHICRLHHACRVLDPPESPCEHVGSLLHGAWDESQNLGPAPVVDQALLKCLSCTSCLSILPLNPH